MSSSDRAMDDLAPALGEQDRHLEIAVAFAPEDAPEDALEDALARRPGQRVGRILVGAAELAADRAPASGRGDAPGVFRSAFVITGPYVLTAWHCVGEGPGGPLWFRLRGPGQDYCYLPVLVTSHDRDLDVAVLALDRQRLATESQQAGVSEAAAEALLASAVIPVGKNVTQGESMRVAGFSVSGPGYDSGYDSGTFTVDVVDVVDVVRACQPGLSGSPVLRTRDADLGPAASDIAVGIVRGTPEVREQPGSTGGVLIVTRIADLAHLAEVGAALRADAGLVRRRSRYWPQIVRLMPADGLLGRDAELAELAEFTRPDLADAARPYADWVGEPYSGKTALAAYFAAHPPAGVDVVAFFVSRAQGHQPAEFWDYACDQLAALLDRSTPAIRNDITFGELWQEAGQAAAAEGRTLLLLIDGLDENEPHAPTISSAIPADGGKHRRVVVFRRDPPALALGEGHPLLDPATCAHKTLRKSKHAGEVEQEARRTLKRLLTGLNARVLGILASAEGPLSAREIAEVACLELPSAAAGWQIETEEIVPRLREAMHLGLVWPTVEDPDRYAFQHRELLDVTIEELGSAIGHHRDHVKAWADSYESRGWPPDTPPYLLIWYPRMLEQAKDSGRLTALMTPARLGRLRARTGDDAAAVEELTRALGLLATAATPDVALACRTALRREDIRLALGWYPVTLIEAKAGMGQWHSARRLASYLGRPDARAEALFAIAEAAAEAGRWQLADGLVAEALSEIGNIAEPHLRMRAVRAVARQAAAVLRLIDPRMVTGQFPERSDAVTALVALAQSALSARSLPQAARFVRAAYPLSGTIAGQHRGSAAVDEAATAVVASAATLGRADIAISVASAVPDPALRVGLLTDACLLVQTESAGLAGPAGPAGPARPAGQAAALLAEAERSANGIEDRPRQAAALAKAARAAASAGLPADRLLDGAEDAANGIGEPGPRAEALAAVARAAAGTGQRATGLFARVRGIAAGLTDPVKRASALASAAWAALAAGRPGDALAAAADIDGLPQRAAVLAALGPVAAATGQPAAGFLDAASAVVAGLTAPAEKAVAEVAIAQATAAATDLAATWEAVADIADPRRRAVMAAVAEAALNPGITDPGQRAPALATVAIVAALTTDVMAVDAIFAIARAAAHRVRDERLPGVLDAVTQAAAAAGQFATALAITDDMTDRGQRTWTAIRVAQSAVAAGHPADDLLTTARARAAGLADRDERGWALGSVTEAATLAGRFALARATAEDMADRGQRASVLALIAKAAAKAGEPAGDLIGEARRLAEGITDPARHAWALGSVVQAALAAGETTLARQVLDEAEEYAIVPDSIVRPAVLGALARAFDAQPARAARLFDQACRAAGPLENLPRALALDLLSRFASRRPNWPGHLTGEAYRADAIDDPAVRDQVLMYLAHAASESGDNRLASSIANGMRDPGPRIGTLLGIARFAAGDTDPGSTDRLLTQASGIARQCGIGWAPSAIVETAAAAGPARAGAQGVARPGYRAMAMAAVACVERIRGDEPPYFEVTVADDTERAVVAEAAYRAGWLATAARVAADIPDLNQRTYLLLRLAEAFRGAGDPDRALAITRSLLAFKGRIERVMFGQALALTVRLIADQDPGQAARELVCGLVDGFDPGLFGVAQELTQRTAEVRTSGLITSSGSTSELPPAGGADGGGVRVVAGHVGQEVVHHTAEQRG